MFKCTVPDFPPHWRREDYPRYQRMVREAEDVCMSRNSLITIFSFVVFSAGLCAVRNWLGF